MNSSHSKFAILVISSDGYKDIWPPFFYCIEKNWPDCPFPVYLGSNTIIYEGYTKLSTLLSGPDLDWSSSLINILDQIDQEYLFVILEDFLIISKVDTNLFFKHFKYMEENQINHMHFFNPVIPYDIKLDNEYGIYSEGAPYRVNVFGFWNKSCLKDILIKGENPWNFEIMGSYRSSGWNNFLSIINRPFNILNLVEKGKFIPASVKFCLENKIDLSFSPRETWVGKMGLKNLIQEKYFKYISRISWRYRVKLMNILRKALISY